MADDDDITREEDRNPFSAFLRYEKGSRSPEAERENRESYGEFLFGSGYEDISDDIVKKPNWTSYTANRILVRLFSRGIMGATFYAMGQAAIRKQLPGYHPELALTTKDLTHYPLRYVARAFDRIAAPPIKSFVRAMPIANPHINKNLLANDVVRFRPKSFYEGYQKTLTNPSGSGRSLGHEIVAITFDFAMGSTGDAWGRQIANSLDPNITNSWYKDGYFDTRQFAKAVGKQAWKILTKNQGEDWAAALPYVYQMRWQRQAINRFTPGFKFLSDRVRAGWQVNKEGQIIGSFTPSLALDFQLRFTGYNWYTLMYRDMYEEVADTIDDFRKEGALPSPHIPGDPFHAVLDAAAYSFRYITKSAIKATIYMTPAVPFFWMFRVPQAKYKGVGYHLAPDYSDLAQRRNSGLVMGPDGVHYNYFDHHEQVRKGGQVTLNGRVLPNTSFNKDFYPHGPKASAGVLDKMLDWNGKQCYEAGRRTIKNLQRLGLATSKAQQEYVHDWVNASISYTPYMIAKAETALRWDKPTMDKAIYRLIDGAAALKAGEVKGALSDIREQVLEPASPRKVASVVREEQQEREQERAEAKALKAQKEEIRESARQLPQTPRPKVADVQLQDGKQADKDTETRHYPPIEYSQTPINWQDRSLREEFSKNLEVPPGASIH